MKNLIDNEARKIIGKRDPAIFKKLEQARDMAELECGDVNNESSHKQAVFDYYDRLWNRVMELKYGKKTKPKYSKPPVYVVAVSRWDHPMDHICLITTDYDRAIATVENNVSDIAENGRNRYASISKYNMETIPAEWGMSADDWSSLSKRKEVHRMYEYDLEINGYREV